MKLFTVVQCLVQGNCQINVIRILCGMVRVIEMIMKTNKSMNSYV